MHPNACLILLSVVTASLLSNQTSKPSNPTLDDTICTNCRCYRIKCSINDILENSCVDEFKNICNSSEIVEENDCNFKCDCCLDGQCLLWKDYNCLMFKSIDFFAVIYFLSISVNFYLLWRFYKNLFWLKQASHKAFFSQVVKRHKSQYSYTQMLWVRKIANFQAKLTQEKRHKDVSQLFDRIDKVKSVAINNLLVLVFFVSMFCVLTAFDLHVLFFLLEKPFLYGIIGWVQHALHLIFYTLIFLLSFKLKSYRSAVNGVISDFEQEIGCKVHVIRKLRVLEVNWAPKLFDAKPVQFKQTKNIVKITVNESMENIETHSLKIKKVEIGERNPKVIKVGRKSTHN